MSQNHRDQLPEDLEQVVSIGFIKITFFGRHKSPHGGGVQPRMLQDWSELYCGGSA